MNLCLSPLLQGCSTSAALIIAIGAKNAFVLKQGILKNHVLATVLICAVIDAVLIVLGVGGLGAILTSNKNLLMIARWGGAAFLFYYGFRSFKAVFKTSNFEIDNSFDRPNFKETILTAIALSLLNPHVYIDTVVLLGSIGAQFARNERIYFTIGAIIASITWFFSLGYGAQYLRPIFQKPIAWKILDFLIGCIMWTIAVLLLFSINNCLC